MPELNFEEKTCVEILVLFHQRQDNSLTDEPFSPNRAPALLKSRTTADKRRGEARSEGAADRWLTGVRATEWWGA